MSERRDKDFLLDIQEAVERIIRYTAGLSHDQFLRDTKTQDAVVRNLEVIGEATKNLSDAFVQAHPQIPWRNLAGLRDKLIHHYFGISWGIVWTIISEQLPELLAQIDRIVQETKWDD